MIEMVPFSTETGEGVEELRTILKEIADNNFDAPEDTE